MRHLNNRLKHLFTVALSVTWAAAVVAFTAYAAPPANPEIREGSLTVYKYARTGETTKPLKGVTFSAWQVLSTGVESGIFEYSVAEDFRGYLDDRNLTAEAFANMSGEEAAAEIEGLQEYIKQQEINPTATAPMTDSTGYTKFGQLPLGWYLILETGAPDIVEERSANFFISLPMLDSDGSTFLYDITAYPKNMVTPETPVEPDHEGDDGGGGGKTPNPPIVEIPELPVPQAPGKFDELLLTVVPDSPIPTGMLELPKTGERVSGEMILGAGLLMMALSCMMIAALERLRKSSRKKGTY